jgi:hypothetical protein
MNTTRRSVLGAVATLATVGAGASQVIARESLPIEVTEVASEEEYVVFENTEIDDVDVSGHVVAFEYGNPDTDQRRKLPDETVIGGGQSLIVATGAKEVPIADVTLDYEGEVLNNDGNDIVSLLTPDESTVLAKGDGSSNSTTTTSEDERSDDGGEESDDGSAGMTATETEGKSGDTDGKSADDSESTGDSESAGASEFGDDDSLDGATGEESGSEDESSGSEASDDDPEGGC